MASQSRIDPRTGQHYCWSVSAQRWIAVDPQWAARAQASQSQPRSFNPNTQPQDVTFNPGLALPGQGASGTPLVYQTAPGIQQGVRGGTSQSSINSVTQSLSSLQVGSGSIPAQSTPSRGGSYTISGPPDKITDPFFLQNNVRAHKWIPGLPQQKELDKRFRKRKDATDFFQVGKVFSILWPEPVGDSANGDTSVITDATFGEGIYTKIRRFIVIREGSNYCSCLPIVTYQYQGVGKKGVKKSDHAIVYTTKTPPQPLRSERPSPNEDPMLPGSIRIHVDDTRDKLDEASRIHFGKIYTVEHNVRVRALGRVHKDSHATMMRQWRTVWNATFDPSAPSVVDRPLPQRTSANYQTNRDEPQLSRSLPNSWTAATTSQNVPTNDLNRAYMQRAQSQSQAQPATAQIVPRAQPSNIAGPSAPGSQAQRYLNVQDESSSDEEAPRKPIPSRRGRN